MPVLIYLSALGLCSGRGGLPSILWVSFLVVHALSCCRGWGSAVGGAPARSLRHVRSQFPLSGIKPEIPALEGRLLTTEAPGNS